MLNIKQYLDSTYLKTAAQAGLDDAANEAVVRGFVKEAIEEKFKLVMIRPDMVAIARSMVDTAKSDLKIGTVIDFPAGNAPLDAKLKEAAKAIEDGADELDFVCDYNAFKNGETALVREQVQKCTELGLMHHKVVKWIIEIAALNNQQIIQMSALIKNCILSNFPEEAYPSVFVKSSTGFYETAEGVPNGATIPGISMMIENSFPLPVKAAGGVRTYDEAVAMIRLGVKRIGTSSAKAIADGGIADSNY